jgi:hypothetical protein
MSDACPIGKNADSILGVGLEMGFEYDFERLYGYSPECPKGCFINSDVWPNCTRCEWPFTTNWEESPYCEIVQLVPPSSHTLAWALISIFSAAVFGATLLVSGGDVEIIKLSCASAVMPLIDTVSDIGMIFMAEIFNLTYINVSHTSGTDMNAACTGLGPFSLWTTFFAFIFVVPNVDFVKYVMIDRRIKSRLNIACPCPWQTRGLVAGKPDTTSTTTTSNNSAGSMREYGYLFLEMAFNACVNLPMVPWVMYGCFLHQISLLGINCYWNRWIAVWSGTTDYCRDTEGEKGMVNARLIKMSQQTHFFYETVPMFVLYLLDLIMRGVSLVSQGGQLQPAVVPLAITTILFVHGIMIRLYKRFCARATEKSEGEDKEIETVKISLFFLYEREFALEDDEEKNEAEEEAEEEEGHLFSDSVHSDDL